MISSIIAVSSPAIKLFNENKLKIEHPAIKTPIATMGQTIEMKITTEDGALGKVSTKLYAHGVIYTRECKGERIMLQIEPANDMRGKYWLVRATANGKTLAWNKLTYQDGPDELLRAFIGCAV